MDFVILVIVLLGLFVAIFKRGHSFVYYIAIIDILLRILDFFGDQIDALGDFLKLYFPSSLFALVYGHTDGLFEIVLVWGLVFIYIIFLSYIIKTFFKTK